MTCPTRLSYSEHPRLRTQIYGRVGQLPIGLAARPDSSTRLVVVGAACEVGRYPARVIPPLSTHRLSLERVPDLPMCGKQVGGLLLSRG